VVLADPGLVITQPVEVLDELEIALESQAGILVDRVKRRQEDSEAKRGIQHVRGSSLSEAAGSSTRRPTPPSYTPRGGARAR
jgi:hypothetical protein